jgi:hypothetical protein
VNRQNRTVFIKRSLIYHGNVNSKCEKNIKKYNQASRANSSRHSANTISEVFQPNISRG